MCRSNSFILVLLLAQLSCLGCGPGRPATVPVKGVITFGGGPPPTAGTVFFAPIEPAVGHSTQPGFGSFDAAGQLTVTSFDEGDGLVPGRYEVRVECWKTPPSEMSAGESHLPVDFKVPEVVAAVGQTVDLKIEVPRP